MATDFDDARFDELRESHPLLAGSLISRHNEWYEKFMQFGSQVLPVSVGHCARDQVRQVVPAFWGNLLQGKARGVQFTVDEDKDGSLELLTFVMRADLLKQEWESFQQQLMQPFST